MPGDIFLCLFETPLVSFGKKRIGLSTVRQREPKLFTHWSDLYSYCWMIRAVWKETFTYGSVRSLRWESSYLLDERSTNQLMVASYSIYFVSIAFCALNFSFAFSTFSCVKRRTTRILISIGSHRYIKWSILMQDCDWTASFPLNPPKYLYKGSP